MIVVLVHIAALIFAFFQAEDQLVNPLIRKSLVGFIARPLILKALVATLIFIPAQIFYFLNRFLITLLLCFTVLIYSVVF